MVLLNHLRDYDWETHYLQINLFIITAETLSRILVKGEMTN